MIGAGRRSFHDDNPDNHHDHHYHDDPHRRNDQIDGDEVEIIGSEDRNSEGRHINGNDVVFPPEHNDNDRHPSATAADSANGLDPITSQTFIHFTAEAGDGFAPALPTVTKKATTVGAGEETGAVSMVPSALAAQKTERGAGGNLFGTEIEMPTVTGITTTTDIITSVGIRGGTLCDVGGAVGSEQRSAGPQSSAPRDNDNTRSSRRGTADGVDRWRFSRRRGRAKARGDAGEGIAGGDGVVGVGGERGEGTNSGSTSGSINGSSSTSLFFLVANMRRLRGRRRADAVVSAPCAAAVLGRGPGARAGVAPRREESNADGEHGGVYDSDRYGIAYGYGSQEEELKDAHGDYESDDDNDDGEEFSGDWSAERSVDRSLNRGSSVVAVAGVDGAVTMGALCSGRSGIGNEKEEDEMEEEKVRGGITIEQPVIVAEGSDRAANGGGGCGSDHQDPAMAVVLQTDSAPAETGAEGGRSRPVDPQPGLLRQSLYTQDPTVAAQDTGVVERVFPVEQEENLSVVRSTAAVAPDLSTEQDDHLSVVHQDTANVAAVQRHTVTVPAAAVAVGHDAAVERDTPSAGTAVAPSRHTTSLSTRPAAAAVGLFVRRLSATLGFGGSIAGGGNGTSSTSERGLSTVVQTVGDVGTEAAPGGDNEARNSSTLSGDIPARYVVPMLCCVVK